MYHENPGQFIISLDFELLWGVRDKRTIESYGENIRGVRQVIPALLRLFEQYHVNVTFATVGFLFARNKTELLQYQPLHLPDYAIKRYSPYENNYIASIGDSEQDDVYHYAESLIRMIQQFPGHEIASHTFSHYYCLEHAHLKTFEADLVAAKAIAATYGVDLKSIVFPRNQYSNEHIAICKKFGFTAYRGNEPSYIYKPIKNEEKTKWLQAARLADSFFNLTGHHCFQLAPGSDKTILNIPASRFLRPYNQRLKMLEKLKINRIKRSMTFAAKNGLAYHLWWHPHNFGKDLDANLKNLTAILAHYKFLNTQYGFTSSTMNQLTQKQLQHESR